MKILLVGNAQGLNNGHKYYFTEQRLLNGFTRLGHNVYVFNDRDYARYSNIMRSQAFGIKYMNRKLVRFCDEYKPDLIMLSHCKNVTNDTLQAIRSKLANVKIGYTNVDPLTSDTNLKHINQRVGVADHIFITTAGDALKQFSNPATKTHFFPNPVDPSLDTGVAFKNNNANVDLLFMARALRHQKDHREDLARYLLDQEQHGLTCHIAGLGVNDNYLYGSGYYELLGRCKMGLSVSKTNDQYLYSSDRMSHYMAAGILTFIPEGPQFEDIFGNDAFVSFSDNDDLIEKLYYYKNNDLERKKIAETGHKKIHDYFSVNKVCQYMIETISGEKYSENYSWPTESF